MNFKRSFLFFCLLLLGGCATAQNYPTRQVNGTEYIVYTVEPGNTLYAISRQFSVSVQALLQNNPGARDGLDIGEEILVPTDAIDKKAARRSEVEASGDALIHTVQKKETLFSLSRMYNVSVNDILQLNPGADQHLSTGDKLKIPVRKIADINEQYIQPAEPDSFMVHQVQQGETVYSLSKKYNVTPDSLRNANAGFPEGLKANSWITIPVYNKSYLKEKATADSLATAARKEAGRDYPILSGNPNTFNIALMLPFSLEFNDSLSGKVFEENQLFLLTEISLEYYRATQIALDSLEQMGFRAKVFVYDIDDDLVHVREILKRPEMKTMHLIIGPMHKATLAVVSEYSRTNGIYLISPNSFSNEIYRDNPYLVRVEASEETMMHYLATFVAARHRSDNVLMINSGSSADWKYRKSFAGYYNKALSSYPNKFRDSIPSVSVGKYGLDNLTAQLKPGLKNILVVPSNDLAFVSNLMTRLSRIDQNKYNIILYGLDSWKKYDNIETAYKNRFHLRLPMANFADYQSPQLINYLLDYRERYSTEPTEFGYGLMGFDVMLYFGKLLLTKGMEFPRSFGSETYNGIYGAYRFGKASSGFEFENKEINIVEYRDYQLVKVN